MAGPHVEPAQERSVDARLARLRRRTEQLHTTTAEGATLRAILIGLLDLLDTEL